MNDYISRDDVLKAIDYQHEVNNVFESEAAYVQMWETINDDRGIKAADVQPIKHGRWTYPYKDKDINQCSECRSFVQDKISNVREMFAYCPFCGARMDGDTE